MAHTLTASTALAAAAAPHEFSSAPARPTAVGFDDEEFPYPTGLLNGAKCCTKCGATKTPQWREGPYGKRWRLHLQAILQGAGAAPLEALSCIVLPSSLPCTSAPRRCKDAVQRMRSQAHSQAAR